MALEMSGDYKLHVEGMTENISLNMLPTECISKSAPVKIMQIEQRGGMLIETECEYVIILVPSRIMPLQAVQSTNVATIVEMWRRINTTPESADRFMHRGRGSTLDGAGTNAPSEDQISAEQKKTSVQLVCLAHLFSIASKSVYNLVKADVIGNLNYALSLKSSLDMLLFRNLLVMRILKKALKLSGAPQRSTASE